MVCSDSAREIAKSEKLINFSTPFDVLFQENNIHDYHPLIKFIIIIIIKTFCRNVFLDAQVLLHITPAML